MKLEDIKLGSTVYFEDNGVIKSGTVSKIYTEEDDERLGFKVSPSFAVDYGEGFNFGCLQFVGPESLFNSKEEILMHYKS